MTDTPTPDAPERAERRARQLAHCVAMQDMGMDLARDAHARALAGPTPAPGQSDPTLAFARATNAVRQAITLENRVADGPAARARPAAIPKQPVPKPPYTPRPIHAPANAQLRQALHEIADRTVADRDARKQVRRHVDDHLDRVLTENPDLRQSVTFKRVARDLGYTIDWAQVPDELLTPPPGITHRPGSRFAEAAARSPPDG